MQQKISVVKYNEKFKADFALLNYEWLDRYFYVEEYDKEVLSNPKKYILDKGGLILFAIYDDKVVGTLALINRESEGYELSKMAVTEKYHGLKIGQKLMNEAIKEAELMGINRLILESNTILEAAINLYKKVGFKEIQMDEKSPYYRSNIKMELKVTSNKN